MQYNYNPDFKHVPYKKRIRMIKQWWDIYVLYLTYDEYREDGSLVKEHSAKKKLHSILLTAGIQFKL